MARRKGSARKGVNTDKDGIVVSRESRHPYAHLFRSIPMGEGLPNMSVPEEWAQLVAIHVFDNLDCSLPRRPKYRAAPPEDGPDTWLNPNRWVPINSPLPDAKVVVNDEDDEFDDSHLPSLDDLDEESLDALENRLIHRRHQIKIEEGMDGAGAPPDGQEPEEWIASREALLDRLKGNSIRRQVNEMRKYQDGPGL